MSTIQYKKEVILEAHKKWDNFELCLVLNSIERQSSSLESINYLTNKDKDQIKDKIASTLGYERVYNNGKFYLSNEVDKFFPNGTPPIEILEDIKLRMMSDMSKCLNNKKYTSLDRVNNQIHDEIFTLATEEGVWHFDNLAGIRIITTIVGKSTNFALGNEENKEFYDANAHSRRLTSGYPEHIYTPDTLQTIAFSMSEVAHKAPKYEIGDQRLAISIYCDFCFSFNEALVTASKEALAIIRENEVELNNPSNALESKEIERHQISYDELLEILLGVPNNEF